ncbi:MAG: NAD(P)/FAD-dependent oxidoreductase [Microcoleaceae cyanobacterium]
MSPHPAKPELISTLDVRGHPPRICILGGGFAGLFTALELSKQLSKQSWRDDQKPQVTLVNSESRFLFTPFLYELITSELKTWEVAPAFEKLLAYTDVRFHQGTVQSVDLNHRQVHLHSRDVLAYDYLVLAVGREMRAWGELEEVSRPSLSIRGFRTLADAEWLQEKLQALEASDSSLIRVAIVGGGPNGVELAGKLADRLGKRGQIHLIVRGSQILKDFTQFTRRVADQSLVRRGVQLRFQTTVAAVGENSITLRFQKNAQNQLTEQPQEQSEELPVDLVIGTVGTQARDWITHLECQHDAMNQLLTHPTLQLVDYPEVFAVGDLADIRNHRGQKIPATAQAAFQQGSAVARNLMALLRGQSLQHFHYLHLGEMLTLGTQDAIVVSFRICLRGRLACLARHWIYILLRMPTLHHRVQVTRSRLQVQMQLQFQSLFRFFGFNNYNESNSFNGSTNSNHSESNLPQKVMTNSSMHQSQFRGLSGLILTVLVTQLMLAFRLLCLPSAISALPKSLNLACDPILYPFLSYAMYSYPRYPGQKLADHQLFGILVDGTEIPVTEKELGIGLYKFKKAYMKPIREGKSEAIQSLFELYQQNNRQKLVHLVLKSYPVTITKSGIQQRPMETRIIPIQPL